MSTKGFDNVYFNFRSQPGARNFDLREFDVIKGVDMHIRSGHFMVFVGPSGCGKFRLMRLTCGTEAVLPPSRQASSARAAEPIVKREEGVTERKAGERTDIVADAAQIHRFDAGGRAIARHLARGAA